MRDVRCATPAMTDAMRTLDGTTGRMLYFTVYTTIVFETRMTSTRKAILFSRAFSMFNGHFNRKAKIDREKVRYNYKPTCNKP